MPVIPHFSSEALENLNTLNEKLEWPNYDENILSDKVIKFVIQINGKKRAIIDTEKGIDEKELLNLVMKDEILKKDLNEKIIKRKIFVSNKLLNIII